MAANVMNAVLHAVTDGGRLTSRGWGNEIMSPPSLTFTMNNPLLIDQSKDNNEKKNQLRPVIDKLLS